MKPLVAITRPIPEPGVSLLRKHFRLRVNRTNRVLPPAQLKTFVAGASAILSVIPDQITKAVIVAAGENLKIVANYAIGFDNIDLVAAKTHNVMVTNTPGLLTEAVAEHTLALLLATARRVVEADQFTRKGHFRQWEPNGFLGPQLWGKTLGIIGLGRIGTWVAQMAREGLGMSIMYHDLNRNSEFEMRFAASYHELPTLLRLADAVTIHVPLLPSTRHLLGAPEFKLMKKTAILVNTSRGPVIDERALVQALRKKEIWAAGLDVFENEPKLTPGLAKLQNVVLTPHIASATHEARAKMSATAAANIVAVLSGKPPLNPVV
ncbi:MAG: D-glycerate dehydrogenase [Patescibacteria group bacterium]